MSYLCRDCGSKVKINENNTAHCGYCDKDLTPKEAIASWTFEARVAQLKAMHELMRNANDEEIYMSWIVMGVPDEPDAEDFEYIAMNDELYNDSFDTFIRLIHYEGNRW